MSTSVDEVADGHAVSLTAMQWGEAVTVGPLGGSAVGL